MVHLAPFPHRAQASHGWGILSLAFSQACSDFEGAGYEGNTPLQPEGHRCCDGGGDDVCDPLEGSAQTGAGDRAADIPAGHDLFVTDPAETHQFLQFPADFFSRGSDAFAEVVDFAGVPLETFNGLAVGDTDTIVQRLQPADPSGLGGSATVDIEIVALSLQSVQPIFVTYGNDPGKLWDVFVDLSPTTRSQGQMTINGGGTFESHFEVVPRFTFTDLADGSIITFDGAQLPPQAFTVFEGVWANECALPALAVAGLNDGFCPGFDGQKQLTVHQALLAQHGVWPAQPALEHFQCYNLKPKPFDARTVELTDQFGFRVAEVTDRVELCNPVRKANEPWSNRRAHLVCYTTDGPDLQTPVTVRNQFGSQQLMVHEPTQLCVPSRKWQRGESLKQISVPIDHFQCYSVEPLTPLFRFGSLDRYKLRDQFGLQKRMRVGVPRRLCAPVDKNGSRIEHPVAHLVCYQLGGARLNIRVVVKNQFERVGLRAKRARFLCVPSAKVVLQP